MGRLLCRRTKQIRRQLGIELYFGAYDRQDPVQVLKALDAAVTALGLSSVPLTIIRELRHDLNSRDRRQR